MLACMKQAVKDIAWIAVLVGLVLLVALMFFTGCGPQPKPGERECWTHKSCTDCVLSYCGWCSNGCYSFYEGGGCPEQVGFVGECPDFTWPKTLPYRLARDAGVDRDAGD